MRLTGSKMAPTLFAYLRLAGRVKGAVSPQTGHREHDCAKQAAELPPITISLWPSLQTLLHKRFLRDLKGGYALGWLLLQRLIHQSDIENEPLPLGEIIFYCTFGAARWMQSELRDKMIEQIDDRWGKTLPELWRNRIEWNRFLTPWTTPNFETTRHTLNRLAPLIRGEDWHPFFEIECVRSHAFGNILHQRFELAEQILNDGLAWAKERSYLLGQANCYLTLGLKERRNQNPHGAIQQIKTALNYFEIEKDKFSLIQGYGTLAFAVFKGKDDFRTSLDYFSHATMIAKKQSLTEFQANFSRAIGIILKERGDYIDAVKTLEQTFQDDSFVDKESNILIDNLIDLGVLWIELGSGELGITFYEKALSLTKKRKIGSQYQVICQNNIGFALWTLGKYQEGLSGLEKALELNEKQSEQNTYYMQGHLEESLAQMWLGIGNLQSATQHYLSAKQIFKELGYQVMDFPLMELGLRLDIEKARASKKVLLPNADLLKEFKIGIEEAEKRGRRLNRYRITGLLGVYRGILGERELSIGDLNKATSGFEELGANLDRFKYLLALGNSCQANGDATQAYSCWQTVLDEARSHPQLAFQAALNLGEISAIKGEIEQAAVFL